MVRAGALLALALGGSAPLAALQVTWAPVAPRYASGRLWAPVTQASLAMASVPANGAGAVGDAVRGLIGVALDSAAREEATRRPAVPVWKGSVAGAEFGLEGPWLILAGVKIPAAVLGLLPVSAGAPSPDQWEDARLLADRRADIERAAVRSRYQDDYRAAIRDIRERREAERALHQAQQRLPARPATDTTPP